MSEPIWCQACEGWRSGPWECGRDECPYEDDQATAELLHALDVLYPLPDDDKRAERAGRTAAVLKQWMAHRVKEVTEMLPRLLRRAMVVPADVAPAESLRAVFTNEVIRAIGSLARQQNVCREQGGKAVFVTGMEAAREYIVEHVKLAAANDRGDA